MTDTEAPPGETETPTEEPVPSPDETPNETPAPETPSGEEDWKGREARARREAQNLRTTLKNERAAQVEAVAKATAERDATIADLRSQLRERDAQLAAAGRMRDPRDIVRYIDIGEEMTSEELDAAIAKLLKEKPYLAIQTVPPDAVPQGQQNGNRPSTNGASDWLRKAITDRA